MQPTKGRFKALINADDFKMSKPTFKPFTLKVEVKSLNQLQALWMIANSNSTTQEFLNENWQREKYGFEENLSNPLGLSWFELNKKLEPFKDKAKFEP